MADLCCIQKLNLPEVRKDFGVVTDLKLVDIMIGIQFTRDHLHKAIAL